MSGYTMNNVELLYAYAGAATTTTPTAGAVSLIATYPPIVIPPNYFSKLGANSSSLHLRMGGVIVTTATIPTFLWGLSTTPATTTPAAFSVTTSIAATTAIAPATAKTAGVGFLMDVRPDRADHHPGRVDGDRAPGGNVSAPESNPGRVVVPGVRRGPHVLHLGDGPVLLPVALPHPQRRDRREHQFTVHYCKLYGEN